MKVEVTIKEITKDDLVNDDSFSLDLIGCEALLQFIMFGEVIYG